MGVNDMTTDFGLSRFDDRDIEALPGLRGRQMPGGDLDDGVDDSEHFDLPGADLSGEEFTVRVVPLRADEFTCGECFLVHHRSQYAGERGGKRICRDCA